MTILRPSLTTQTITIIPRYDVENVTISIRDKQEDVTVNFNVSSSYANGYMTLAFNYEVVEAKNYDFTVKNGNDILFRGMAFATDETDLENYKINSDY